jgi:hypothetical protein
MHATYLNENCYFKYETPKFAIFQVPIPVDNLKYFGRGICKPGSNYQKR